MRKTVPFHKTYTGKEEIKNVVRAIKSGWHTMGPGVVEFEKRFKVYTGAKFAIAVNSGTAALHLALEALGIKEGDEVLVPAITFAASAETVCHFKATPVFVDVERDTINMNVRELEKKINSKTRAIITVDFGGQPVDYDEVHEIARRHKLFIIEDAAHTLPSAYKGRKVGTLADITCFSFYATKTLNTGEGGMITTDHEKWARRMKMMRLHGMSEDVLERSTKRNGWFYEIVDAGFKYNTTDINAALGMAQLDRLEWMWERRAAVAESYTRAFKKMPEIIPPTLRADRKTSWHLYVLKLDLGLLKIGRDQFIRELAARGIGTGVHFIPLYRHPFYRDKFKLRTGSWPDSEWLYERILSLPIYPGLTKAQIRYVIASVREVVSKYRKSPRTFLGK